MRRSTMPELRTILYVEDDPDIREIAGMALSHVGGFDVTLCESGEAALRALSDEVPDMVLLDVMMPGMDGPATLSAIREIDGLEDLPIVFVTAKIQPAEVAAYRDMGAVDVIAKPYDPMTISQVIREIWSRLP
jgi:two-component system, OmpR family, response regulator